MKRFWNYIIIEPLSWLFYCFFQPIKFKQEIEVKSLWRRVVPMFRLTVPMFLVTYFFILLIMLIPCRSFFHLYIGCYPDVIAYMQDGVYWISILNTSKMVLLNTIEICLIGIALGIVWGCFGGILWGVLWGMILSITLASINANFSDFAYLNSNFGNINPYTNLVYDSFILIYNGNTISYSDGIVVAILFGITAGCVEGMEWGIIRGSMGGIIGGIAWTSVAILESLISYHTIYNDVIMQGIYISVAFIICYVLGYYRFPLYIISGPLTLRTYFACRRRPSEVFHYLHRSPLYWDECVFIPLLGLKSVLLIAAGQSIEACLSELAFINNKRPQQLGIAQAVSLEIAIQDLEMRDTMHSIGRASQRLAEIFPLDANLIDPGWQASIARLRDVSRDAARYYGPFTWQVQRKALEDMLINLERVNPHTGLRNSKAGKRISVLVTLWRDMVRREQVALEEKHEKTGYLDNPYNAGGVLETRDSLFVGRRDLVSRLSSVLSKGHHCPPFLLNGERRMGKSSTLKQLPALLGGRYIPVLYDLQSRGITSSAENFLITIAENIREEMSVRGIHIKRFKAARVQESRRKNEAIVYHTFEGWLKQIEHVLEQQDRTLLLLFDEFEKLDEAAVSNSLDLSLLLDWFRNVIQHYPRVALLFSGVRTFSEMGMETNINWAGYFVNVQTLRVSFLHSDEARRLILQPVPGYPGEQIFAEPIVEEILRVTGCHPFLVQAICWTLIELLNFEDRNQAEVQDVEKTVNQVLEYWDAYFRDLWQRTDEKQRSCLITLKDIGEGSLTTIQQSGALEENDADHILQVLRKRDLVLLEQGMYRIAIPIFGEWVKRCK